MCCVVNVVCFGMVFFVVCFVCVVIVCICITIEEGIYVSKHLFLKKKV
jgi:hypothetical protein